MFDAPMINMINLQVIAEDVVAADKANGTFEANKAADRRYYLWQSELQTYPMGMDGNPEQFAARLAAALPGVNTLRLFFNESSFDGNDKLHEQYERLLEAAAAEGFQLVMTYGSGDAQGHDVTIEDVEEATAFLETEVREDMTGAWTTMLDWMDRHPDVAAAVYGYEIVNEPAMYAEAGRLVSDDRFVELYAEHMIELGSMIDERSDAKILVGGWGYSAKFNDLDVGDVNGQTALEAMRASIGEDLVWSAHLYAGWFGTKKAKTTEALEAVLEAHYAKILGDEILLTETNGSGSVVDNIARQDAPAFLFARSFEWFAENGIGLGWFPGAETGASNFVVIDADGSLRFLHQSSLAHGMNAFTLDEEPAQHAHDEAITTRLVPGRVRNEAYQPAGQTFDDTDGIAYGFGYGGNDTITGQDRANDLIYGGPGDDVLEGEGNDDHLFGQYGNDVLRGGPGDGHLFGGDGDDWLHAGDGDDQMNGGEGADTFEAGGTGTKDVVDFSWDEGDRFILGGKAMSFEEMLDAGTAQDAIGDGVPNDLVIRAEEGTFVFHNLLVVDAADIPAKAPMPIAGTEEADRIRGTDAADEIRGEGGNDAIQGRRGDDLLYGGSGDDTLSGGQGNDTVHGEGGDDVIHGNKNRNHLMGGEGDDTITTGYHADTVEGGEGDDVIFADVSRGGDHVLAGGPGADRFALTSDGPKESVIVIVEFEASEDTVDLSGFEEGGAQRSLSQNGKDVVVSYDDGDSVTFHNQSLEAMKSHF